MKEDRIISALIGLVGACNNNGKTNSTDSVVIKALAFPLLYPDDDKALEEIIDTIHLEKYLISPGCAECMSPCGNISDYDMHRIYEADDTICKLKLEILKEIQKLAVSIFSYQALESIDNIVFYKALSYVSYDLNEDSLMEVLDEIKKIKCDIKSRGKIE